MANDFRWSRVRWCHKGQGVKGHEFKDQTNEVIVHIWRQRLKAHIRHGIIAHILTLDMQSKTIGDSLLDKIGLKVWKRGQIQKHKRLLY